MCACFFSIQYVHVCQFSRICILVTLLTLSYSVTVDVREALKIQLLLSHETAFQDTGSESSNSVSYHPICASIDCNL